MRGRRAGAMLWPGGLAMSDGSDSPLLRGWGPVPVAELSEWARLDSNQGPTDYEFLPVPVSWGRWALIRRSQVL